MTAASVTGSMPPSPAAPAVLEVNDLSVRFHPRGRGVVHAVSGLSYSVPSGRTVAIIGESGSGKTASSRAIMGLLPRSAQVSGSARLAGTELIGLGPRSLRRHRGRDVAMIFQDPARSLNPTMEVGPQIAEAIRAHNKVSRSEARERAIELFKLVRLSAPEQRYSEYPHQFSGGMRQRVMIAMALALSPRLLIADEPTTALDVTVQAQIMQLLTRLQSEEGMFLVLITHDLGVVADVADRVVLMYAGRVVETGPLREVYEHSAHPYTSGLMASVPALDGPRDRLIPIQGSPPDLLSLPSGCSFRPRCQYADAVCADVEPDLRQLSGRPTHRAACHHPEGALTHAH